MWEIQNFSADFILGLKIKKDFTSCAKFHLAIALLLWSQEVIDYIKSPNSALSLVYCSFIKFIIYFIKLYLFFKY